ncbi:ATP-binding cassette domain-containing protein [Halomonas aestuarii]|uniref:ATP-binding cassette domain-containing protein n=1 Tax=Halomonas aestuarii TaxID=1897729 RepID=UPI000B014253|nr:ATP-binding cassette domain-containing protein [Halomonas aestuarii]
MPVSHAGDAPPPAASRASAARDALVVEGLCKTFRSGPREIRAVDGAAFRLRTGQVTGLIGPDGAGKTTLMRLIAGLLVPDRGSLSVLDIDVVADPLSVQASIGYMPQRFGLYEDLSVQENLDLYADLQGLAAAERPGRYRELLAMTGLEPFTERLAGRLSGGMKQKLGLACTLVRPPRLLLLDEPTVGVDPISRRELWRIVYRLVEEEGMSVLLSTAYLDEAERCAEVVLMHEGRVLGQQAPERFGADLSGRVWYAQSQQRLRRHLQVDIAAMPGVLDAVIDGDGVRTLLEASGQPPTLPAVDWQPVDHRFEDAFVARLRASGRGKPEASHAGGSCRPAASDGNGQSPPGDDTPMIEVSDLTRRFGDFVAVRGIAFAVRRGEIFGLLGANGAGKSTTFRMLSGLLPASEGRLSVAGVNLRQAAARARARLGYMSQTFALYGVLTVQQNLRFFARSYGLRGARLRERLDWAVDEFDLGPLADEEADNLPLGYKQRLAMACALMHEPDILFLDEPTSGVDPLERRAFWNRISALADAGVTIMVTTHFMDEAEYCDRLVIMSRGSILTEGSPQAIRRDARREDRPHPSMEDAFVALIEQTEGTARDAT